LRSSGQALRVKAVGQRQWAHFKEIDKALISGWLVALIHHIVSSFKCGTIELAVMNSGIFSSEAKELAILNFPFLFANEKESDAIVDEPIGKKMHALLEPKGIIGLSYWEIGYR
jgi:hypothetical protein